MNSSPKIAVMGIPYDANSSFEKGPAEAPAAIRKVFLEGSLNKGTELGVDLRDNPRLTQLADVEVQSPERFVRDIETAVKQHLANSMRLVSIGGDHSVTYPILRGYHAHFPNLTIVHIDAHSDLYHEFKGNRHSNACPFARIMEEGLCKRLIQIGIRTLTPHQEEQIERFGVECQEMRFFAANQKLDIEGDVYLSVDIDGIDPAFAPGVSHREPGGLTTRNVINIIHQLKGHLVGADIVEFNPRRDIDGMTAQVATKLVKETLGSMLLS